MFGKLFAQMYDGTLVADWEALVTFQQMIVLSDSDGVVDMTPHAISARTGIPLNVIEAGIEILERPDEYSRTPTEEGRRIVRLDDHRKWGWQLVNHKYYRDLASLQDKRDKDRERIAAKREEAKKKEEAKARDKARQSATKSDSRKSSRTVANVAYTDTDTYTDTSLKELSEKSDGKGILFEIFWNAFGYKQGKKKAKTEWGRQWDIIKTEIVAVITGAEYVALQRPSEKANGKTPIMAQGWISGHRWQDEVTILPHENIVRLYLRILPDHPPIDVEQFRTSGAYQDAKQIWERSKKYQTVDFWLDYFTAISKDQYHVENKSPLSMLVKASVVDRMAVAA